MRIQSIVNNYALSIEDRVALYTKVRTEGYEKNLFQYQLMYLIFGDGKAKREQNAPSKRRYTKLQGDIRKSVKAGEFSAEEDLVKATEDEIESLQSDKRNTTPLAEVYLQKMLDEAELNDAGLSPYPVYHFDRQFAAGRISTSSFPQSLLCQSYFRPYILETVRLLIEKIVHLPVLSVQHAKPYLEVANYYISRGYIPLGLYRNGAICNQQAPATPLVVVGDSTPFPYVYTNCRQGDLVFQTDLIFAIRKN